MPYNDSSHQFARELDEIAQNAQRLQNTLDTQRNAALRSAEASYKKDFETQAKYNEKALKTNLEAAKKAKNSSASMLSEAQSGYQSYVDYASNAFQNNLDMLNSFTNSNSDVTDTFVDQWEQAFSKTSSKATGFKGFMDNFLNDLGKKCANQVMDLLKERTTNTFGGGLINLFGSTLGGMFAEGGRPPRNKVSLVGEKGPELFVPDAAGTVVPNDQLGASASSVNVNQYFSFQSLDPVTNMKMLEQQKSQIQQWVVEGIQGNQNNLRNAVNGA